jgi:DNA-binding XRE family transcriptional regulator
VEWTAESIRRLRADAQITQAELATWLGVTVKQVKHLENRRRNPSGPVERLLDIFAKQHNGQPMPAESARRAEAGFGATLNASRREPPAPRPPADDAMVWSS